MILLLSGEGPTDLGHCNLPVQECSNEQNDNFIYGVLIYILDSIFHSKMGYFLKETPDSIHYKNKSYLVEKAKSFSGGKRLSNMRGAKKAPETAYYFNNARALGLIALDLQAEKKCPVIAVLFRDSDGTNSAPIHDWQIKYDSMVKGFESADCFTGVPMLAKPKSEAWLLAACKEQPYLHCHLLENEKGNDSAENPLKAQLEAGIGQSHNAYNLVEWIKNIEYDYERVASQMPSFKAFYQKFTESMTICLTTR